MYNKLITLVLLTPIQWYMKINREYKLRVRKEMLVKEKNEKKKENEKRKKKVNNKISVRK